MQHMQKNIQTKYTNKGTTPQTKQLIIKMPINGSGIRDISRVLNMVVFDIS
jgi:transposase-like protein